MAPRTDKAVEALTLNVHRHKPQPGEIDVIHLFLAERRGLHLAVDVCGLVQPFLAHQVAAWQDFPSPVVWLVAPRQGETLLLEIPTLGLIATAVEGLGGFDALNG